MANCQQRRLPPSLVIQLCMCGVGIVMLLLWILKFTMIMSGSYKVPLKLRTEKFSLVLHETFTYVLGKCLLSLQICDWSGMSLNRCFVLSFLQYITLTWCSFPPRFHIPLETQTSPVIQGFYLFHQDNGATSRGRKV
jgi:hypothetical protein